MKKTFLITALALAGAAAAQDFKGAKSLQYQPQGSLNYIEAATEYFSGKARFARYPAVAESKDGWAVVDFDTGTVNNWHSHSKGQYLIITEGVGLVQEWGKPIRRVHKGDAVWFPPGVKHWHGAAPGHRMSHIAIAPDTADNQTVWYEAVDPKTLEPFAMKADAAVRQTAPLTRRQLAIVPIAALTAEGRTAELKTALENGLAAGLSVNEIREIFTHLHAYAGFPRALNGLLKERAARGIQDPAGKTAAPPDPDANYAKGVQTLINMGSARATEGTLFDSEGMDYALKANLFGYLFGRGVLSYTDREIVVLATIASLGKGVESQLGSHFRNTHALGVKQADLQKVADAVAAVNAENGANAKRVLNGLGLK